jgi:hypothetical protein
MREVLKSSGIAEGHVNVPEDATLVTQLIVAELCHAVNPTLI